jgi:predicted GIY-YIG superfamily endonuclease
MSNDDDHPPPFLEIAGIKFEKSGSRIYETAISRDRAAVYVIVCKSVDTKFYVVDVGESGDVETRLANHDRRECWDKHCSGTLHVYLCYMPTSKGYTAKDRRDLESKIRSEYNPPCGQK